MVKFWHSRKKQTMCGLAEKKVGTILGREKGRPSEYQKLLLENLKQRHTAMRLKDMGVKKEILNRATLMKWETKQMMGSMEKALRGVELPLARREMQEQKREVERQFEEIIKPKLDRDIGEMLQPPTLRNAKRILKKNVEKNSK